MEQEQSAPPAEVTEQAGVQVDAGLEQPTGEEVAPQVPELSDADYELNFLGSHRFQLPRETPTEIVRQLQELNGNLNKNWSQRNMKLAEERRAILSERDQVQQQIAAERANLKDLARVEALQDQIKAYDEVNWPAWIDQDPSSAQKALAQYNALKAQYSNARETLETKQRDFEAKQQAQAVDWLSRAEQRISASVPGWTPEKGQTLAKFAAESYLNTGSPVDQYAMQALNWHPGLIEMLHDAFAYRESLKRATAAPVAAKPQPVSKVGGVAPVAKDPNQMSDDEWIKWRNQDLANKRRAAHLNNRR